MTFLKKYWAFFVPYVLFLLLLGGMTVWSERASLHLWLNSVHTSSLDVFFKHFTLVGEWVPFVLVVGLLFYRFRAALLVLASQLAAGLVTQVLKRAFDVPRPKRFFEDCCPEVQLHVVKGVHLHSSHSFPSGHTTSAFALFLALALLTNRRELHFVCFLLAVLVGYSRVYLSQHFASDVWAGSLIGVTMTILVYCFMERKHPLWYDRSLLKCKRAERGKENKPAARK